MRKVMILASMLAMVMLAASPALAQNGQLSGQFANGENINQLNQQCQNVVGDINVEGGDQNATIVNANDATAVAGPGGDGGDGGEGGDAAAGNDQYQYGDEAVAGGDGGAGGAGGDGGDAAAVNVNVNEIAQEQNLDVTVVQNCLQTAEQNNVINVVEAPYVAPEDDDDQYEAPAAPVEDDDQYEAPADDQYVAPEDDDAAAAAGAGVAADDDAAAVAPAEADDAEGGAVAVLPDTGGASLFTLGAGALLVAGGLLARKIVR